MTGRPPSTVLPPPLRRVRLQHYRSIARCDVTLRPLTVLAGPNGSGKSHFVDALRLIGDGLREGLSQAVRRRGGIEALRRQSSGHPSHLTVEVEISLPEWRVGRYRLTLGMRGRDGWEVREERLEVRAKSGQRLAGFTRRGERVVAVGDAPALRSAEDRLHLAAVADHRDFREAAELLAGVRCYHPDPAVVRTTHPPDPFAVLGERGEGVGAVVARLRSEAPAAYTRLVRSLAAVVPDLTGVERVRVGREETVGFRQRVAGARHPWRVAAVDASDGTLRVLAALAAAGQAVLPGAPRVVLLEEPEAGLHPAAVPPLLAGLRWPLPTAQILLTTHRPEVVAELDAAHDGLVATAVRGRVSRLAAVRPGPEVAEAVFAPGGGDELPELQGEAEEEQIELFGEG
jgi:predicted ATPase